ncbi:MAG: inorganic pyrophosphatase [Polyangiales bacterium]|jgi:inorganic pyrophosphatase
MNDTFLRWRPHPWHGLEPGPDVPKVVTAYIEITPFDMVKYEVDKESGYLRVDRPQRTSSQPPMLYGFIPKTYCASRVAKLMGVGKGDGDPLDICVLSDRPINQRDLIMDARVVGGLPMIDGGEADDKIIAVLDSDYLYKDVREISDVPSLHLERVRHYFSTYKLESGKAIDVEIGATYGREHAAAVIQASIDDYADAYGSP